MAMPAITMHNFLPKLRLLPAPETKEDILRKQKEELESKAKELKVLINRTEMKLSFAKDQYHRNRLKHSKIDRELAKLDGRYKVLPPTGIEKKKKVVKKKTKSPSTNSIVNDLTQTQIESLAKKLGLEI